jgi:hypothetical protein
MKPETFHDNRQFAFAIASANKSAMVPEFPGLVNRETANVKSRLKSGQAVKVLKLCLATAFLNLAKYKKSRLHSGTFYI